MEESQNIAHSIETQCTAYTRKHVRCRFVADGSGGDRRCLNHADYYDTWWSHHAPIMGWRSIGRSIREDYQTGFAYAGPPPEKVILGIPDTAQFFDYWLVLCLTFPDSCALVAKPRIVEYTVNEYARGRIAIHSDEWRILLEKPEGGVRTDVAHCLWESTCHLFFGICTSMIRSFLQIHIQSPQLKISETIHENFTSEAHIFCTMLDVFAKKAPWYFFSGHMEIVIEKYTREFMKGCVGEFFQIEGKKCMNLISQNMNDKKRELYNVRKKITDEFFEELVSIVWHPRRVCKWVEIYGTDILFDL